MCTKNFLRRVVPFFAAFLMGVFIASFFGSSGRLGLSSRRARHFEEDRQIRLQNERLLEENFRLREQLDERSVSVEHHLIDPGTRGLVPPPRPAPP